MPNDIANDITSDMHVDIERLETRLGRLERRNRLLAAGWLVVIPAVAVGMSAGDDTAADVVKARRFHMVDGDNRVRAELGIDADGSAGLFLRDADGRVHGTLIHDDDQTALYLHDSEGTIRVGAAQFAHGGGGFALHGDGSKGAAVLYLANRRGSLRFFDEDGAVIDRLPAPPPDKGDKP